MIHREDYPYIAVDVTIESIDVTINSSTATSQSSRYTLTSRGFSPSMNQIRYS